MRSTNRLKADCKTWVFITVFTLLIVISAFLLFYKLDVHYMHYYDEHFYGLNAYEMVESNDYIVHTYMGEVNMNNIKPPLGLWAIALCYKLFGFSLFSMRAQSAIAMLLSQIILGLWARKRFGNIAGLAAVAMLIATQEVYGFHFARFGDLDALYQLFFMLAMLCMIDSKKDFRRLYCSAVFCGLAYLTKSWHATAIAFTCFAYLLLTGRMKELTLKRILLLLASFLAIVLPWAIARVIRDGFTIFQQSIFVRVAGTIKMTDEASSGAGKNIFGYFVFLFQQPQFTVALAISAFSGFVLWLQHRRQSAGLHHPAIDSNALWGCAVWLLATPILLAFIEKKLEWYVYSSLYASAMLTGLLVQSLFTNQTKVWTRITAIAAVITMFMFGTITSYREIEQIKADEPYRILMAEVLDRNYDSGLHVYMQYSEQKDGAFITEWTPTDYLYAKLYGDVACLPGGVDAFLQDDEYAMVLIGRRGQTDTIEDLYIESNCVADDYYVCAFAN